MDVVFKQKFTVARITPFRNYSRIGEIKNVSNLFNHNIDEITDDLNYFFGPSRLHTKTEYKSLMYHFINKKDEHISGKNRKRKGTIKFFYNNDPCSENISLCPPTTYIKDYKTTKERHIKSFYNDPFSKIDITTTGRIFYKSEDKLIIKLYRKRKLRSINWKFFRKEVHGDMLCFNLKTGNFTTIVNSDSKIKPRSGIRKNYFPILENFISKMFSCPEYQNKSIDNEYKTSMNNEELLKAFNEHLFNNTMTDLTEENLYYRIVDHFVKMKKIKVPNDYYLLLTRFYPTQKYLKKNDNKLIQAILDRYDLKSKGTVKLLHENNIHLPTLLSISYFFGENYQKYISRITPKMLIKDGHIGHRHEIDMFLGDNGSRTRTSFDFLTKYERENILSVINDPEFLEHRYNMDIIRDHIRMLERLKDDGLEVGFDAKTYDQFNLEHAEFSKYMTAIRKGFSFELVFNEKMLAGVESDIDSIDEENDRLVKLTPYILKRDEDYTEEGTYMHHCVASYANRERSLIISLRNKENKDRVTCEYDIQSGRMIQERYFCNNTPPKYFEDGLLQLRDKVKKYASWGILNWLEKRKVPIKINGKEIKPKEVKPTTFHDVLLADDFF